MVAIALLFAIGVAALLLLNGMFFYNTLAFCVCSGLCGLLAGKRRKQSHGWLLATIFFGVCFVVGIFAIPANYQRQRQFQQKIEQIREQNRKQS